MSSRSPPKPPPLLLPLSVPAHPPHRTGPMTGFAPFSGSLVPFGGASPTPPAVLPGLARRRRANAISVPRPTFSQVREKAEEERKEDEEDAAMRWAAEEGVPTSPKEKRKGSLVGMEWEGVVLSLEGFGIEDGGAASSVASTSATTLHSPSSGPVSPSSPPTLFDSLPSRAAAPCATSDSARAGPSPVPPWPPSFTSLASATLTLSPSFSPSLARPLKRDRAALEDSDGISDRRTKRSRTSLAYFDLFVSPTSRSALGLAGMSVRSRARRTISSGINGRMAVSVM